MKKMMFYLIFLSLMACSKTPNCTEATDDPEIAKCAIIGEWRLIRTFIVSRTVGPIHVTGKVVRDEVIIFKKNEDLEFYVLGQKILDSPYRFAKGKEFSNLSTDEQNLLNIIKPKEEIGSLTTYRICNDSLYLRFNSFRYDELPDRIYAKK
jgi:hypothetical protein